MLRVKALRTSELREGGRITKELYGRTITILKHKGKVHAVDSKCYHMGGPLGEQGDIEELANGQACITCPWHRHRINLETGGRVESDLCGELCTSSPQQRVHKVIDDSESIWVILNTEQDMSSDKYNVHSTGLGSSAFGVPGGLGGSGSRGLGSLRPESELSAPVTTAPTFLMPYGGMDKYYPPPSPVKSANGSLPFRGVRAANLRGAASREAVKRNYRPPPSNSGASEDRPGGQRKITEMFGRQAAPAQQQWQQAALPSALSTGVQDMEF